MVQIRVTFGILYLVCVHFFSQKANVSYPLILTRLCAYKESKMLVREALDTCQTVDPFVMSCSTVCLDPSDIIQELKELVNKFRNISMTKNTNFSIIANIIISVARGVF